jgi:hypothetical protein
MAEVDGKPLKQAPPKGEKKKKKEWMIDRAGKNIIKSIIKIIHYF